MLARLMLLGASILTFVAMDSAGSSRAQTVAASNQTTPDSRGSAVDEVALRYYASVKQTARVEAETRRLQRLHPDWQPPADLWTSKPGNPDDGPLWELFAADKLDELHAAIRAHQVKDRNWTLSTDLEQKLRRKELRVSILAAIRSRRWNDAVTAANNWRSDISAGDVEVLWLIAEGYARTRRTADAQQVLETILKTSIDPKERIATIQKALAFLPMRDAERLIKMGKTDAAGKSEFDAVAIDITRARISAWLHETPGDDISASELSRFQEYALASSDPDQSALLAWYALKRSDLTEALEDFKTAIAKGGDATVAHGLAHTLRKLGQLRDAEEVAYAWREPSPANSILFIDILAEQLTRGTPSFDPKRLARYAEVTLQTNSGEGAQALAWYAYNSCQLEAASEWFKRAMAWFPKETTAIGYALTLRKLKRNQEFVEIVNRYDGLFPTVVSLLFPVDEQAEDPCNRTTTKANLKPDASNAKLIQSASFTTSHTLSKQAAWSVVPLPTKLGVASVQENALPKRTEFPIAVAPENPYRSQSAERSAGLKSLADSWRPSGAIVAITDARRVSGVGIMPYERYGRTLLAGWNGAVQPNLSPDSVLRSPKGTQWFVEQWPASVSQQQPGLGAMASILPATPPPADAATRFHP